MDTLSHGLWGGVAFGRENKTKYMLAFAFGSLPDVLAFGYQFILIIWRRSGFGQPEVGSLPDYVFSFYDIGHSLVIAGIVALLAFLIWKKNALPVLAWPLHILLDIFTHSAAFFPTPYIWPLPTPFFNGIPWGTPWIFFGNWVLIVLVYMAWYISRRRKKRKLNASV